MKIFLIGKYGQLGSALQSLCIKNGYQVNSYGSKDLNILNYQKVRNEIEKHRPDIVINTAAYHVVADCEVFPEKAFAINAAAQKNIAEICGFLNIRLVYYSTDRVYGGKTKRPNKETDPIDPVQIYGISKLAGELITQHYQPNSLIIRTCGLFGGKEGSREKKGNFVLYIIRQSKNNKTLEVASDQMASFCYTEDLAKATFALLKKKSQKGIFNIANEGYTSWAQFAKEIVKLHELDIKIIPVKRRGSYQNVSMSAFTALDTTKIQAYKINLPDWKNALARYSDYLKVNGI